MYVHQISASECVRGLKYKGKKSLEKLCLIGAKRKGLDIINDGVYKDRYQSIGKNVQICTS